MTPTVPAILPTIGVPELIIILAIVLIFFGVGKLPQVGEALGKGIRSFKDAVNEDPDKKQIEVSPDIVPEVDKAHDQVGTSDQPHD